MCCFFVNSISRRIYKFFCLQGSSNRCWNPGIWCEKVLSMTKETQTSLSVPRTSPSPSSPLKLFCLVWNFGDGFWTLVYHLPWLSSSWIKQAFLPTVLAFEQQAAKLGFFKSATLPVLFSYLEFVAYINWDNIFGSSLKRERMYKWKIISYYLKNINLFTFKICFFFLIKHYILRHKPLKCFH